MTNARLYPDARPTTLRRFRAADPAPRPASAAAGGEPAYAVELARLGASPDEVARLRAFLAERHPAAGAEVYHGLEHTEEVASLAARVVACRPDMTPGEKALFVLAAALHDVDPDRAAATAPRVLGTLAHLAEDREARVLVADFGRRFGFAPEKVMALVLATDFGPTARERAEKDAALERAVTAAFRGDPRAAGWARLLSYLDRAATYALGAETARARVAGLERESGQDALAGTPAFLDGLREDALFWSLPALERARFEECRASFGGAVPAARRAVLRAAFAALAALAALLAWSPAARAAAAPEVSAGVLLGEPIGGTAKLWFDDRSAADLGLGLSDGNFAAWGDLLWHDWKLLPQPAQGRLGGYVGVGGQVRSGDEARFGIRTVVGLSFLPKDSPLELFAEAGPLFRLTQGGAVDAVGGIGLRVKLGRAGR